MIDTSALHVLVVDDEEGVRSVLPFFLRKMGHFCAVASDGFEALGMIRNGAFDLVISDIRMPGKDGLELMVEAKRIFPGLDFIITTGRASEYSYSDTIARGATDFISKPIDFGELQAKIERLQREKSLLDRLRRANEALSREAEVNSNIAQLSRKLMESRSLDEMALLVLDNARRLTESSLGYIGYIDYKTGILLSPAGVSEDIELYGGDDLRNAFEELALWSQRHGQSLLANGFENPELLGISCDGYFPLDRVLSVPAIANGDVLGQIVLANSARDYTEQDADRLQSLATMYALATQHLQGAINLRRANDYLENIFENSPDAIGIVDRAGRFLKWNRMAAELYGYTMDELKNKTAFDLYADENELQSIMAILHAEGAVRRHETSMKRKDGTVETFEISIGLLTDPVEGPLGSVCIARDLSPLKAAIEELRRTHREMSQLVASIPSFLIELDEEGRITRWNNSAERILGLAADRVLGVPLDDCPIKWDRRKVIEAVFRCQAKNEAIRLDSFHFVQPDGKDGFLNININSIIGQERPGILLLGNDITKRKILESQLVQALKLESIGQLAAGIAHEINTPAQYVGDNARFLHEAFGDLEHVQEQYDLLVEAVRSGEPTGDYIRAIEIATGKADLEYIRQEIPKAIEQSIDGIDRISRIVRAMKEFSHPGTDVKKNIDLNKAIESTITVARNEWKYVADMVMDFDPDLPLVPCLPGEFNQVILNMIINATHAIIERNNGSEQKGTITIGTRFKEDFAEIRIGDTGTGIREDIRSKIFDPFFTTKEVGKGTGQGLAISHAVVVDKHGGSISVETERGNGTTFIIKLPLLNESTPGAM